MLEIVEDVEKAKTQLEVAQDKFNWATTDEDVEVAIYQLLAAETFYNRAIKIAKKEGATNEQCIFDWKTNSRYRT